MPFNYPLLLMAWKVAPALAAGNTRHHQARRRDAARRRCELARRRSRCLPPGVVGIVTGTGEEAGEALVRHPHVDMIAFTGSTATGKRIMRHRRRHAEEGQPRDQRHRSRSSSARTPTSTIARPRRGVGPLPERRPGVHVGQAVLRRRRDRRRASSSASSSWRGEVVVGDPRRPETDMGPLISREALRARDGSRSRRATRRARGLVAGGGRPGGSRARPLPRAHGARPRAPRQRARRARRCSARSRRSCGCATSTRRSRSPTTATTGSAPTSTRTTCAT